MTPWPSGSGTGRYKSPAGGGVGGGGPCVVQEGAQTGRRACRGTSSRGTGREIVIAAARENQFPYPHRPADRADPGAIGFEMFAFRVGRPPPIIGDASDKRLVPPPPTVHSPPR